MPRSVDFSFDHNEKLYKALLALFAEWEILPAAAESLAMMIAHQSALETEVRRKEIHRGLNTERAATARRYLESF